ncbi:hypothetical protein CONCODRAFT_11555 [Conidiobolus coronatus NRRL 28638]|uniref:Stc1 domain-containing protein n=1 Tax=Conidiobolus coronatus (strain ATCC 28846 / CBS 209.66 / NRRL 28638) TaxID=796925 RepID=A0A137NUW3_CONC2|nr:hypothetical protein CONCODRAFT_11555 [Conidiobolus coronatus NRRL 28638]|eukprot:KXN66570.1 hypothetical protein CONCODRAFT_11555 [Conidiobolus coronatus NRRL 28638]
MPKNSKNSRRFRDIPPAYSFKPEELRCRKCDETYSINGFTIQKLHELYKFLKNHKGNGPLPRTVCKNCTPSKNTGLKCSSCQRMKPLSQYSKNQRTRKQYASCMTCIEKYQNEDVESSGAEYSDLGPSVANYTRFSTPSQHPSSLHDQFSAVSKVSPTNSLTIAEITSPAAISFQEGFQSFNTETIPPFNTEISSLYQLIGRKNPFAKNHSINFSNSLEMNENSIPGTSYINNNIDPVCKALDQFPYLKDILRGIRTTSKIALDNRTQQFRSKNSGRLMNRYTQ